MRLHDYQVQAVDFLQERKSAGLFLDMGLGKTAIALSALTPDRLPALVIAPKRVAREVWPEEARLWAPALRVSMAVGLPGVRHERLREANGDIVVTTRDNLGPKPGTKGDLQVIRPGTYKTLILDELSGFKSPSSVRFRAVRRFLKDNPNCHVWGLTGTPTPNGMLDLWSQVYLLDQGQRLYPTVTAYRNRYFMPGRQISTGVVVQWILRPGAEARIHSLLEDLCLSMGTEGRVHVPPVTVVRHPVKLPAGAAKVYRKMKDDLVVSLDLLGGEVHSAANAAVLTGKLSQITAGFMYTDDQTGRVSRLHEAKVSAVAEIVEGAVGSPVLVFYRFKEELAALRAAFPEARTIDSPNVVKDWNAGNVPILLAHPASAGHGLNLQAGGHTIVWTSPSWSLEEDQQANKRLARQGQQHPVVIHYLTCPGTVDEAILARVRDKVSVQQALLDHLELK